MKKIIKITLILLFILCEEKGESFDRSSWGRITEISVGLLNKTWYVGKKIQKAAQKMVTPAFLWAKRKGLCGFLRGAEKIFRGIQTYMVQREIQEENYSKPLQGNKNQMIDVGIATAMGALGTDTQSSLHKLAVRLIIGEPVVSPMIDSFLSYSSGKLQNPQLAAFFKTLKILKHAGWDRNLSLDDITLGLEGVNALVKTQCEDPEAPDSTDAVQNLNPEVLEEETRLKEQDTEQGTEEENPEQEKEDRDLQPPEETYQREKLQEIKDEKKEEANTQELERSFEEGFS
jgi:hypothetical protein